MAAQHGWVGRGCYEGHSEVVDDSGSHQLHEAHPPSNAAQRGCRRCRNGKRSWPKLVELSSSCSVGIRVGKGRKEKIILQCSYVISYIEAPHIS